MVHHGLWLDDQITLLSIRENIFKFRDMSCGTVSSRGASRTQSSSAVSRQTGRASGSSFSLGDLWLRSVVIQVIHICLKYSLGSAGPSEAQYKKGKCLILVLCLLTLKLSLALGEVLCYLQLFILLVTDELSVWRLSPKTGKKGRGEWREQAELDGQKAESGKILSPLFWNWNLKLNYQAPCLPFLWGKEHGGTYPIFGGLTRVLLFLNYLA